MTFYDVVPGNYYRLRLPQPDMWGDGYLDIEVLKIDDQYVIAKILDVQGGKVYAKGWRVKDHACFTRRASYVVEPFVGRVVWAYVETS